jgi:hypothetical protein
VALFACLTALGPSAAAARPPSPEGPSARLGLPSLEQAERYVVAPHSRVLRPRAVDAVSPVNLDYVSAASAASEVDAHDLDADPTSRRVKLEGVGVRVAGPGEPGAEFSYRMRAPRSGSVRLRIEEPASASADYDVLVNGERVHRRGPEPLQRGIYSGLAGLVHYDVAVPRAAVGARDTFKLTFRNAEEPGPGARIAAVWVNAASGPEPEAPYGGSVHNVRGLVGDDGARTSRGGATTLRSDLFGRPYVVLDFGQEVGGRIELTAERLSGKPKLALAFSEARQYMTTASDYSADPPAVATETHLFTVGPGRTVIRDPDIRGGFRYLMVYLAGPGSVRLSDLKLRFTAAPLQDDLRDYRGAFLSSSSELNRLWYAGAYTVQLSTIDPKTGRPYPAKPGPARNDAVVADGPSVIADAPKRDRYVWGGDLVVADPVAYLTTADAVSPRGAFEWLARKPSPEGQPAGVYLPLPGDTGWRYDWGEYAAWWIVNYHLHWLYTGDRAFLDRWFGQMQGAVGWFESKVGADGLVDVPGNASGHWGYGNAGKETYVNALYVLALGKAAELAEISGRPDLAVSYREKAERTAAAINAALWDPDAGAYVVEPGVTAHPQDGNAMAILAGVATGDRAGAVLRFFREHLRERYGTATVDRDGSPVPRYISPFVSYLELEALASRRSEADTEDALALLRRTWGHMLRGDTTGTFWENISLDGGPQLGSYTSLSHGWAAGPVPFLTNRVLGVSPASGGFGTFEVLPHPGSSLRWAAGDVPTPRGTISAAWRRTGSRLELAVDGPSRTTYTAGVPDRPGVVVRRDGRVVWGDGQATEPGVEARDGYVRVSGLTGSVNLTSEVER